MNDEDFNIGPKRVRLIIAGSLVYLFMLALAALFLLLVAGKGRAHEAPMGWSYEQRCCSGIDCRPVERDAILESPNGYVIRATGEVIPYSSGKIRPSQDSDYHWCSQGGKPDTPTICLYAPHGGS